MKKYFTWTYYKTAQGHRLLLIIAIAGFALWYIFRKVPEDNSKDAFIKYKERETDSLIKVIDNSAQFLDVLRSSIEGLKNDLGNKDKEIIRTYERIQNNIHHYDTASVADLQRFFDQRYPTGK